MKVDGPVSGGVAARASQRSPADGARGHRDAKRPVLKGGAIVLGAARVLGARRAVM